VERRAVIVVDTHAWLWWMDDPTLLSHSAHTAIEEADAIGVPTICCWELAMLVERRRIALERDVRRWVRQALAHEGIETLPLTAEIALDAALLEREQFVGDPADRIVYATARAVGSRLVTKDRRLHAFDSTLVVW
jgi:PIN domain nuclease of toxin-antitoxin system